MNIFEYIICKLYFTKMRIASDSFSINKQDKSLDMNFIAIKTHERESTLHFFIFKDDTLNFFIFKKGNHKTLIRR